MLIWNRIRDQSVPKGPREIISPACPEALSLWDMTETPPLRDIRRAYWCPNQFNWLHSMERSKYQYTHSSNSIPSPSPMTELLTQSLRRSQATLQEANFSFFLWLPSAREQALEILPPLSRWLISNLEWAIHLFPKEDRRVRGAYSHSGCITLLQTTCLLRRSPLKIRKKQRCSLKPTKLETLQPLAIQESIIRRKSLDYCQQCKPSSNSICTGTKCPTEKGLILPQDTWWDTVVNCLQVHKEHGQSLSHPPVYSQG